jgi:single-strand DNA-binding protein
MAEGLNRVMLFGNLGSDPELRFTKSGQPMLKIRLATNERYKDQSGEWRDRTEWHRVTVWGRRAESLSRVLTSGATIFVEGALRTQSYTKDGERRYSTEIHAHEVLLGGRAAGTERTGSGAPRAELHDLKPPADRGGFDDLADIPF